MFDEALVKDCYRREQSIVPQQALALANSELALNASRKIAEQISSDDETEFIEHAFTVMRDAGFEAFDNVAGGETAGIPFGALVAERMALPMTYVRKKPKGYGRNARIEGVMTAGQRVLLVEDMTTDGGSKISFVEAIRETGATCAHTAVIFFYDIFPDTREVLGGHGIALHSLCTWWDVLAVAKEQKTFDEETLTEVEKFLRNPAEWQAAHS